MCKRGREYQDKLLVSDWYSLGDWSIDLTYTKDEEVVPSFQQAFNSRLESFRKEFSEKFDISVSDGERGASLGHHVFRTPVSAVSGGHAANGTRRILKPALWHWLLARLVARTKLGIRARRSSRLRTADIVLCRAVKAVLPPRIRMG